MSFRMHVIVFGGLGIAFGIAELISPAAVLKLWAMSCDDTLAFIMRYVAVLNLSFGLVSALTWKASDALTQRAVLWAGVAYSAIATAVSVHGVLSGVAPAQVYGMLLITVPLGLNAARLLVGLRGASTAPPQGAAGT